MIRIYILTVFVVSATACLKAQENNNPFGNKRLQHHVIAGLNIGALSPVSLPNTIRKVESYNPKLNPSIGYGLVFRITPKWFAGSGLQFDVKGMRVKDSVQYFHTLITVDNGNEKGEFEGDFTGTNRTSVRNMYLTAPVFIIFQPGKKWRYNLGLYFAGLLKGSFEGNVSDGYIRNGNSLGEKVEIQTASFDFRKELKKFDWGFQGGAERYIGRHFSAYIKLQWGMQPGFPESFRGVGFKMYNIFGQLGASYTLFH